MDYSANLRLTGDIRVRVRLPWPPALGRYYI